MSASVCALVVLAQGACETHPRAREKCRQEPPLRVDGRTAAEYSRPEFYSKTFFGPNAKRATPDS